MESNRNLHCLTCSIVFFGILFFLLIVTFVVFTIFGLNEEIKSCDKSHLWIYSLVSLLLLLKLKNTMIVFTKNNNNIMRFIELLTLLGMITWGIYEFFYVDCVNELNDTILYKTSFIYLLVNIILLSILLLFIISDFITGLCLVTDLESIENKKNLNEKIDILDVA